MLLGKDKHQLACVEGTRRELYFSLPYNAMVRCSKQTAGRSSIASSGEALSPHTSRAQTAGRLVDELETLQETFNNTSSFRKVAAALTLSGAEDAQVTQLAEIYAVSQYQYES